MEVGTRAPSKTDSTINLRDKLGVIMCASWNGNDSRGLISMMRSFGCRCRESETALCISAFEFDDGMLAYGLMKVTINRRRLNASLVSKILSIRFASSDGLANLDVPSLAIEMVFDEEKSTKSRCILLWYCFLNLIINQNVGAVSSLKRPLCSFAASWEALHISSLLEV